MQYNSYTCSCLQERLSRGKPLNCVSQSNESYSGLFHFRVSVNDLKELYRSVQSSTVSHTELIEGQPLTDVI